MRPLMKGYLLMNIPPPPKRLTPPSITYLKEAAKKCKVCTDYVGQRSASGVNLNSIR